MRKYSISRIVGLAVLAFSVMLSSCKKSHETPVKPKLSFSQSTMTAKESDDTLHIAMTLDLPAPEAVTVTYELTGTAKDKVSAGSNAYDYEIIGTYLESKILKGATSGTIDIKVWSDFALEDDETIVINIKSTDSDNIEITREDNITITLQQEDGLLIGLTWPDPTIDSLADMDLLLRVGANTSTWDGILTGSVQTSFTGPEVIFLPKVVDYAAYGLSYTYYDGTIDSLGFTATFIDFENGAFESQATQQSFDALYTLSNKNKWTDVSTTQVVQTFAKTGGAFVVPADPISIPAAGSRIGSSDHFTSTLRKNEGTVSTSKLIQTLFKRK